MRRVLAEALAHFGHVDVWVNNAGRSITRRVSEPTDEDFDEMMRVNVKSALYGIQAVRPRPDVYSRPQYRQQVTTYVHRVRELLNLNT